MKPFDMQDFARELCMGRETLAREIDQGKWVRIGTEFLALEAQFRAAQNDPKVVMPSALSLAIEGVLLRVMRPASPYAPKEHQSRSDLEMSTNGQPIRPGQ